MSYEALSDIAEFLLETAFSNAGKNKKDKKSVADNNTASSEQASPGIQTITENKPTRHMNKSKQSSGSDPEEKIPDDVISFELNRNSIMQAVVYSELLVQPVCRKRRRCRSWR